MLLRPIESSQYTALRFTERLAEAHIKPSIGTVGDAHDNSLAESLKGLYNTELISGKTVARCVARQDRNRCLSSLVQL